MSNQLALSGAQAKPTRYSALWNESFSIGLSTQRNPLRAGSGTSLMNKLYPAATDAMLDGLNVEISNRLTPVRRPGSSVYNSNIFPPINQFAEFRLFGASNTESIKVLADTASVIYDATGPSTKDILITKSSGAGNAYFQSVGNTMYIGDGVDQKKWLQPTLVWTALAARAVGDMLIDSVGLIQLVTVAGTSGATVPAWSSVLLGTTVDGTVTWTNYQSPVQNWGVIAPTVIPTANPAGSNRTWQAGNPLGLNYSILDPNNSIEVIVSGGTGTGTVQPIWATSTGTTTRDGGYSWLNVGPVIQWLPSTAYSAPSCIQDSNGNLQFASAVVAPGTSGATAPAWSTVLGVTTTDGNITWKMVGAGTVVTSGAYQYAYSFHDINGGVSTASPVFITSGSVIGPSSFHNVVGGTMSTDTQVDRIWIWRTVQGGSTLLFLASVPNDSSASVWIYNDTLPDTSLNNLVVAPIALSGNPPPVGITKMTYHLGRIWGVVNNMVYFSGGPDTTTGNGSEAFPPANVFVFPDQVNRLYASSQGLFVFTVSDVFLIQGTSTASFFSVPFLTGLGLLNYNAWAVNGSTIYMLSSDLQVVSCDMSTGVSEVGFPIGDQFLRTTTAGFNSILYNASTARVTWHISGSQDKGLYVSDFANGWFRLYPTPSPETGLTWAPFANIVGGVSTVQSVETSPGTHSLLIGPKTSGPILKRDDTMYTDNGSAYESNFLFGSLVLAQPGQLAELVFLTTDSIATGTRPSLAVQLDEISPFSAGGFENLPVYAQDPPQLSPSTSMYSQRFYLSQTQQPALCRSLQIRVDWGSDTVQNELLSLTVFGAYSNEMST